MRYPKQVLKAEVDKLRNKDKYTTKKEYKLLKRKAEIILDSKHFSQGINGFRSKNPTFRNVEIRVLGYQGWIRTFVGK